MIITILLLPLGHIFFSLWYVHFASLFYIIIYCYSLIYFIFRDDTYVISSILHVWWLLKNSLPESGFYWKKNRQDTIFLKASNSRKIPRSSYFVRRRRQPEGEAEVNHQGPTPPPGVDQPSAAPPGGVSALAHFCQRPFVYIVSPKT
jgi:hypothetical protein